MNMIGLVRNEWKKVFLPVLLTTVLLAIAMSVLSCTIYQNYTLHYDLEAWEVGTELFSLLYPLFVVVPLCWNLYYERKNNFLLYVIPRVKIKKYLTAKWIAYALGTLCIIVIPYILSAVFALYVKPPVVPFVENPFSHIFENAFIKTPLLYAVALSLWRGIYVRGNQLGKNGCDFPESLGVFINSPGFIGIYNGFQNLKFLADIQGKIGEKEIRQAMSKVGLDPDNKTKVDNYSLGMKQKLGLAQAIMEGQDILILDEPFNALDYKTYEDVKAIIRMLKAEGKTIFLTSHHYKDIEQLCDQVYSLEDCQLLPITEEIAARYREMD